MNEFTEIEVLLLVLVAVAVVLFVVEVVRLLRHRHFNWSRWIYAIILCAVMLGLIHLSSSMFSTALPTAGGGGQSFDAILCYEDCRYNLCHCHCNDIAGIHKCHGTKFCPST